MKHYIWITFLFFAAFASAQTADERITRFHADIVIDADGRVEVTEHITYHTNGDGFHGITRTIPQTRKDAYGRMRTVPITLLSVICEGVETPYHSNADGSNLKIWVGDADVLLDEGDYQYIVQYESYGHVGFFDDYDEIYWNVTGTASEVPIDAALATVTLPNGAEGIRAACYTGKEGSTEKNCTFEANGKRYEFEAGRPLAALEGLTVAVAFPRDIIARPTLSTWDKYGHWLTIGIGGLICLLFFFITWLIKGRNARTPIIIPSFKAPKGWSPAEVRYAYKQKFDGGALSATLLHTAVNGGTKIVPDGKTDYNFEKGSEDKLTEEDKIVYNTLFSDNTTSVSFSQTKNRFSTIYNKLETAVKKSVPVEKYYNNNFFLIAIGGVLTLITILAFWVVLFQDEDIVADLIFVFALFLVGIAIMYAGSAISLIGGLIMGIGLIAGGIGYLIFVVNPEAATLTAWLTPLLLTTIFIVYYRFALLSKTKEGAEAEADLEGFRMYMKTAEEHRLNILTPPDRTPALFEKLLPYAVALDVENEWCDKFTDVLKAAAYQPEWYYDPTTTDLTQRYRKATYLALTNALNRHSHATERAVEKAKNAVSSSSGSRSWSSGSSGGGRSGGGGGGGSTGRW